MTAEIAIMNKSAIALAADSAVTFNNPKGQKIKNSVNKLFTLSKYAPVGIMIYGNSELTGVPWETAIKIYRKALGSKSFGNLEDYGESFINFLEKEEGLFSSEDQETYVNGCISGYFMLMKNEISKRVEALIKKQGKITDSEIDTITGEIINHHASRIEKRKTLQSMTIVDAQSIKEIYKKNIDEIRNKVFEKIPLPKKRIEQLEDIVVGLFVRDLFSLSYSGVVVAGFGESEKYPTVVLYRIEGVVNNKLKYKIEKAVKITAKNLAWVMPFAQSEMVVTFMEGIDPQLQKLYHGYMAEVLRKYPETITDRIKELNEDKKKELKKKLSEECNLILDDFKKMIDQYRKEQHINPITNVVSMLPKDELAAMAEALVNLTSFKRKVSMDDETVGGPIDVAVISKGDGFVWIKRKHYFDAQLNHHFWANYYHYDEKATTEGKP